MTISLCIELPILFCFEITILLCFERPISLCFDITILFADLYVMDNFRSNYEASKLYRTTIFLVAT